VIPFYWTKYYNCLIEGVIFLKVKYTLERRLEILDEWKKANNGSRNTIARKFDVAP